MVQEGQDRQLASQKDNMGIRASLKMLWDLDHHLVAQSCCHSHIVVAILPFAGLCCAVLCCSGLCGGVPRCAALCCAVDSTQLQLSL